MKKIKNHLIKLIKTKRKLILLKCQKKIGINNKKKKKCCLMKKMIYEKYNIK